MTNGEAMPWWLLRHGEAKTLSRGWLMFHGLFGSGLLPPENQNQLNLAGGQI